MSQAWSLSAGVGSSLRQPAQQHLGREAVGLAVVEQRGARSLDFLRGRIEAGEPGRQPGGAAGIRVGQQAEHGLAGLTLVFWCRTEQHQPVAELRGGLAVCLLGQRPEQYAAGL